MNTLRRAILGLMEDEWSGKGPSPDCFEASDDNILRLVSFVHKLSGPRERDLVTEHLLDCARCRHVYGVVRKARATREAVLKGEA